MMRKRNLVAITALTCAAFSSPLRADDDEITWLGSYREAVQQARQTEKPILVEFRCEA
jgi:hypothetical protein